MIDHKQNLLDMAEQLEQPFLSWPFDPDAAQVAKAKVLRAAAAHLQRETEARKAAQQELAELRERYLALGVRVNRYGADKLLTAADRVEQMEKEIAEWRDIVRAVMRELPRNLRGDRGNAPGHAHRIPGVWDDDNGSLSGQPCAWCMAWSKAKAYASNKAANHCEDVRKMVPEHFRDATKMVEPPGDRSTWEWR